MEGGSKPESTKKVDKQKGKKSKVEPFVSQGDHNARDLRSWAKRTGFVSIFSGEVGTTSRDVADLERGGGGSSIDIDPVTRNRSFEIEPALNRNRNDSEVDPILPEREENQRRNVDGNKKGREEAIDIMYPGGGGESGNGEWNQPSEMKCGIRDNPGLGLFSSCFSFYKVSLSVCIWYDVWRLVGSNKKG